ncbi:acetyl-CoA carboxylase biotin carboxyl carrier protein [Roseibium algae]|uniref:Biotin carboxyl carrier protein of acetyl-CoA carboxylase n=1 Tax=Roseibium algae TaxID=3123038 RepID=A0ABU8TKX5_9HYPH
MTVEAAHLTSIMEWMSAKGVKELDLTENGVRFQIVRDESVPPVTVGGASTKDQQSILPASKPAPDNLTIKAEMSGLCHLKPNPASAPFVQVGDTISAGQTLYVIEAMKVMTSVSAKAAGTLEEILITNGVQVDPGTPLFRISA